MLIVIQNGSNLVNIDLAQDDIVGEGPFNMVFSDGCLFPSRGYLLTPGEIRTFVEDVYKRQGELGLQLPLGLSAVVG